MIIDDNIKKLNKYLIFEFCKFLKVKIFTVTRIKNGFSNSIGWSLKI